MHGKQQEIMWIVELLKMQVNKIYNNYFCSNVRNSFSCTTAALVSRKGSGYARLQLRCIKKTISAWYPVQSNTVII